MCLRSAVVRASSPSGSPVLAAVTKADGCRLIPFFVERAGGAPYLHFEVADRGHIRVLNDSGDAVTLLRDNWPPPWVPLLSEVASIAAQSGEHSENGVLVVLRDSGLLEDLEIERLRCRQSELTTLVCEMDK